MEEEGKKRRGRRKGDVGKEEGQKGAGKDTHRHTCGPLPG